ncbi:Jasmonoyl--L-amino acid synthetase JAR4 [Camellia lanceoleosa]|uniref:Jasmonoyl--L-amino acid synthetase JAR4 n=1 Tax=Camellia lanceoleosa TaxID=1840588 RepID=A0ACC0ICF4_9ERIC|nr:Jasmonoyl--L-amino acid synthetase JAR4 [Camellia lanceoleosa]
MLEKMDTKFDPEEVIEEFDMLTNDTERVQKETLQKLLEKNDSTEYLKKWGFNERTDNESFEAFVPLVSHKDLEPCIHRMVDGDTSPIFTGKPIATISLSSGTTQGKPKFVTFNNELMETTMQIYKTFFTIRNRSVSMLENMDTKFDLEKIIKEFEMLTKDAERVQKETLQKILEENGSTGYLKKWDLNGRTDHESFKGFVPLFTNKDLEPYIQRMVDGDTSPIFTGKPITTISLSSGTTQEKSKFVLFNNELMESTMQICKTFFAFRNRVQKENLQKILEENGSTEYLKKWGLNGRIDHESIKAFVPLVTHKDLEPYIQRMVDGDTSPILTGKPITTISLSSGTTQGKPKFVPFNNELIEFTMQIYKTFFAFRNRLCSSVYYKRIFSSY